MESCRDKRSGSDRRSEGQFGLHQGLQLPAASGCKEHAPAATAAAIVASHNNMGIGIGA
jgi:hypothetical protein